MFNKIVLHILAASIKNINYYIHYNIKNEIDNLYLP